MYTYTRQEAADFLGISTRSIDRYAKGGKIRSKKMGKIIYLHADDVNNLSPQKEKKAKVIISQNPSYTQTKEKESFQTSETSTISHNGSLEKIYLDLRSEIQQKDAVIQDLSLKLGRAQEIAKNSVSIVEFKKSQFLLEESKGHIAVENTGLKEHLSTLEEQIKYEKRTSIILMIFCVICFIAIGFIWFLGV